MIVPGWATGRPKQPGMMGWTAWLLDQKDQRLLKGQKNNTVSYFWIGPGLACVFVGIPLLGLAIVEIFRQFETPQERAIEDQEYARQAQAAKAKQDAKDLESDEWAWAEAQRMYVKANVLTRLKDPGSCKFLGACFVRVPEIRSQGGQDRLRVSECQEVSFGGYTGMKDFVTYKDSLYIEPESRLYTYWISTASRSISIAMRTAAQAGALRPAGALRAARSGRFKNSFGGCKV